MKKGSTPQLAAAWWNSNQPDGLATARALKTALDAYETACDKLRASGTEPALKVAGKALKDVEAAVADVLAEAAKLLKTPPKKGPFDAADVEETVKTLKKCPAVFAAARDALDDMLIEEPQGVFADPNLYRKHLRKALARLEGGKSARFAFAAGQKAAQHRLALSPTGSGHTLGATLTEQTGLHTTTFGTAAAHPEQAQTITLTIEGKQLPGLKKKAERLLKAFKPLPFAHVVLMIDGKQVDDIADPDDIDNDDLDGVGEAPIPAPPAMDATILIGTLGQMMRRIPGASGGDAQVQAALVKLAAAARKALADGDLAQASADMDQLLLALQAAEARTAQNPAPVPDKPSADGPAIAMAKSVRLWDDTRRFLQQQLRALETAIVEQSSDESDAAEIKARAPVLEQVLERLDDSLSTKLNQIYAVPDPAARTKLRDEAREIVLGYRAYAATEPLMGALDANPFGVAIGVRARVGATLDAILLHI